jgi:glycosyltransferase involved in cell wall biosynthesis
VVEIHGDWRSAATLYGGRSRRVLAAAADRAAGWALHRADRVRVVGAYTQSLLQRVNYLGPVDRFVAFSDYDLFLDPPVVSPPREPRVIFVGSLEPTKGVDVLLAAWAIVAARLPDARLVLVGDGSARESLRRSARHLADFVTFTGPVPRSDLPNLYDHSSCLVLPSRSEGLARVLIEAMARARPVVGSTVGGIPEVVEHGRTGMLVAPEDPSALAEAILSVLVDRPSAERMGAEGRRRMLARKPIEEWESGLERLATWVRNR